MSPEEPREPQAVDSQTTSERFDDDHYPAYTMGRAVEMLNTSAGFLRGLGEWGLIEPQRSTGGHRRYSRYQLRLAARVREMVDQGTGLDSACRIVTLEDQLQEARDANKSQHQPDGPYPPLRGV